MLIVPLGLIKGSETHCRFRSVLVTPHCVWTKVTIAMWAARITFWDPSTEKNHNISWKKNLYWDTLFSNYFPCECTSMWLKQPNTWPLTRCHVLWRSQVENLRYGDCVSVDLLLDTESVLSQFVSQSILTTSAEGLGYPEYSVTLHSSKQVEEKDVNFFFIYQ